MGRKPIKREPHVPSNAQSTDHAVMDINGGGQHDVSSTNGQITLLLYSLSEVTFS